MNTAVQLLQQYNGSQPFGSFIKQFFSQHKKYGSKDRKHIAQLCYAYFRLGKALPKLTTEERLLTGLFFCSQEPNELLQHLKPDWNDQAHLPLTDKIQLAGIDPGHPGGHSPHNDGHAPDSYRDTMHDIFPWQEALSANINYETFCASFFTQPDLFLRLRPGAAPVVKSKLHQAGIAFREIGNACLALPNASKVDTVIEPDKEAVIQDYSSQRIGEFLEFIRTSTSLRASEPAPSTSDYAKAPADKSLRALKVWDACAASGGKSILAYDIFNPIDLTVSDVRKSILINLEKRFAAAGIKKYNAFLTDLSTSKLDPPSLTLRTGKHSTFDIIITDVPCTGSGTWSRTPEQLYYFDPHQIDRFSALQKKIVHNAIPHLKPGGFLLYCTCSVFNKENEEVVQYIQEQHPLQLLKSALLTGYEMKADTLFGAVFQKK
ncbi:MAG TPA: Fmu (Sun) domain-containing protein [Niastella sp.]